MKGEGNQLDFGARLYDPRIGRWLSLDPIQKKYPAWSPFTFAMNSPLKLADANGEDVIVTIDKNSITFSSTIYVTGPGAFDVAKNANGKFDEFSKASLQNRTYKDVDGTVYNVQIQMNFVAVNPDDPSDPNLGAYKSTFNDPIGGSGNNILNLTNNAKNLIDGRANAGHPASSSYAPTNEDFLGGNVRIQARYTKGVGNMAYLNAGLSPVVNGLISIHETFHNFGIGDRYMDDVPYTLSYFVDGVERTESVLLKGISQEGFENDMMSKGIEFSQEHIENLSKNALNLSKIKGNKFVMSRVVDNVKVTDKERAPKTYISGKSVYKKVEKKP